MNQTVLFQSNDELWEKAANTFGKTKKCLDQDVLLLQEWLKTQPHLPDLLNSHSLKNFLLLNKFSLEVTKHKIDNYYTLTKKFEEQYGKTNPELEFNKEYCKTAYTMPSLKLTSDMCRIGFFKIKNENVNDSFDPVSFVKRLITMQELRLRHDVMFGDIIVADCKDVSISAISKITPALIYTIITMYEKMYSMRLKAVYLMNFPSYAAMLLSLIKKVIKPKIFERIHILEDENSIKNFISDDVLPVDFGGNGPSLDDLEEILNKTYEENSELFRSLDEYSIDESLRLEKLTSDDLGVYGSFRKIDVD